jgi:2-phospho-L-lactate guanylyltransferase
MGQGTIKTWDRQSRAGVILDDGKNEIPFDYDAYRESGIREFRLGQRVKFRVEGEGRTLKVRDLTIVSF